MKTLIKFLTVPFTAALLALNLWASSEAQLMLVESQYRIVDVDFDRHRIAVALPEAAPDKAQTWVTIDLDTKASERLYDGQGYFRDLSLNPHALLRAAEAKEGHLITVQGGRDWDGSISADRIWI